MDILSNINSHDDLLRLTDEERIQLCSEIREFLVSNVSKTGGHLAGNLGVVELSVAIETVYNTHSDRLVFDVGHQSYVHKLLTGRRDAFSGLRQFGGISGFPKPGESETDAFVAGHASSSVSIALGMARARTLLNQDYHVVALIGDGAATGGMAYEGLNDAAESGEPMVIILNDNKMSIGKNVGGLSRHLSRLRSSENYLDTKKWYRDTLKKIPGGRTLYRMTSRFKNRVKRFLIPGTIFENMGLTYLGPVDGHDVAGLISLLRSAKEMKGPVLVHVVTQKGNGYTPAEEDPAKFHGIGKFDPVTGKKLGGKVRTFSDSFGEIILELAAKDPRICCITAAMPGGTGLLPFMKKYPSRFFDVGIAEEHAVSMAGGLAKQGMIPVVAIYSTFLQRAFDQIIQDVSMLHLHVVFAIDRAGLVGDDGPTHHGVFDVGFLRQIPGMLLLAPASMREQQAMFSWAVEEYDGPVAIRYPRGGDLAYTDSRWNSGCELGLSRKTEVIGNGTDAVLICYGTMIENISAAAEALSRRNIHTTIIRLMQIAPLPMEEILSSVPACCPIIIAEEVMCGAGVRDGLQSALNDRGADNQVIGLDLGTEFVNHGSIAQLYQLCGLDAASIADRVEGVLNHEK